MLAVGAGACQVTVTESVAVPPGPVAVMRKVSLPALLRLTDTLPLRLVLITDPSRVTDTEVALVDDHVIVTDPPAVGLVLLAEMLAVGAGACQVTVTESVAVPPGPVAVMVNVMLAGLVKPIPALLSSC